jgi:hypothetical protein
MEVKFLENEGEPTKAVPLKDGLFEMQLPKAFFEGNPKSFEVEWVDFYRGWWWRLVVARCFSPSIRRVVLLYLEFRFENFVKRIVPLVD